MSCVQQLLEQQLQQLSLLEQLLQQEKEIIQQQKPEPLLVLTEQKNSALKQIEQLDKNIIAQANFKADKDAGLYQVVLLDIEQTLARCKELNHINGQIINHSQLAVERLKSKLLESRSKSTMTYDNKGKTHGGLASIGIKA
jgi:flagellar biosynthesis protein FlgN